MSNSSLHDDPALASRLRRSAFETLDHAVEWVRQAQAAVTFYHSAAPERRTRRPRKSATEVDELRASLAGVRAALGDLEQLAATLNQQLTAETQHLADEAEQPTATPYAHAAENRASTTQNGVGYFDTFTRI